MQSRPRQGRYRHRPTGVVDFDPSAFVHTSARCGRQCWVDAVTLHGDLQHEYSGKMAMHVHNGSADLFRHVSAEKAAFYRCIMDVFAAAKRQYRLQLRPDEVLAEALWPDAAPRIEELNAALSQLAAWGNLESQPDTARVSSLSDFYRARMVARRWNRR